MRAANSRPASLLILAALLSACAGSIGDGAEPSRSFDATGLDASAEDVGLAPDADATTPDATAALEDAAPVDAQEPDATPSSPDAAALDAAAPDATQLDAEPQADAEAPDAGASDAGASDLGAVDEGVADAGLPDTGLPDTGLSDTGLPDTGARDAAAADAHAADATARDAAAADAHVTDAGAPDAASDGGVDGGSPDAATSPPYGLGTATIQTVASCGGAVAASACYSATIRCPGIADMAALLKVTDPTGMPIAGTVVLGTGGGGGAFYETFGAAAVSNLIQPLLASGYRVIQRAWQPSWLQGPGGARRLACRYSTLIQAIHDHLQAPGTPLCVSGNSGGSAEISYALAQYGMGSVLDLAVPTSGPPLGRLDYGCLPNLFPTWPTTCASLVVAGGGVCSYSGGEAPIIDGTYGPTSRACSSHDTSMRATFAADSVLTTDAILTYPNTLVHFLYGGADTSSAVPLGRVYAAAVTGSATTVVPNAPHAVPELAAGSAAILDVILGGCVLRH